MCARKLINEERVLLLWAVSRIEHLLRDHLTSGLVPENLQVVGLSPGHNDLRLAVSIQVAGLDVFDGNFGSAQLVGFPF